MLHRQAGAGLSLQQLHRRGWVAPVFPNYLDGTGGIIAAVPGGIDSRQGPAAQAAQQLVSRYLWQGPHTFGIEGNSKIGTRRNPVLRCYYRPTLPPRRKESRADIQDPHGRRNRGLYLLARRGSQWRKLEPFSR